MTVTTLKLPAALINKFGKLYMLPNENLSEAIRRGLGDFLLLPFSEQLLDEDALEELLTIEEELTRKKISIRIPDDLLVIVEKLAGEGSKSEIITRMLARVLSYPLETANTKRAEPLIYVLGNKWNPEMQKALKQIVETTDVKWENSVETCAGGIGIFSNITFAQNQVLNDNDWNKGNLLKVIRDYPRELIVKLRALETNKNTFDLLKNCTVTPSKSPNIAAAACFLYLNCNSVMGKCECFDKGSTNEKYYERLGQISLLHRRLQNVGILDMDIFNILRKYRKTDKTVFIVDPPYLDTSGYEKRIVRNEPSYGKTFGLEQHRKLATILRNIKQKDGNDFIFFCRVTSTRHKDQKTKQCKNTQQELAKADRDLQRKIGKLYFGRGFYYIDVNTSPDGTTERIITSFPFDGAIEYGKERECL